MIHRRILIWMFILSATVTGVASAQGFSDSLLVVRSVDISGNKVTRKNVILRELPFGIGDTIPASRLSGIMSRSKDNLMNTSLFNFVTVRGDTVANDLLVHIDVTERWYIWPIPIFEHAERNFPAWLKDPEFSKLNYGVQINWNNFRGRRELIALKLRFGYKEQYDLVYSIPNLGKNQQHGLTFSINKFRQHKIIFRTAENKPQYLNDQDHYTFETLSPAIAYTWRPGLYVTHSVFFSYADITMRNDLYHEDYLGTPPGTDLRWFNLSYWMDLDYRDYKIYPLKGYLLSFRLQQQGLGLIRDFDYRRTYFTLIGAKHTQLLPRLYLGDAAKIRLTKDQTLPYIFREGLGYDTYLRGFEYYVIDGNSYFISVNNLKYALIPGVTQNLKWVPLEQFGKVHFSLYANLFFDIARVNGPSYLIDGNNLENRFLYSSGLGLDLVTYYDQVYRLEFTLNSLGEPGIYLHLETPFRRW